MSPSERRTLRWAMDASCTSVVADAEYALARHHCTRAARAAHIVDLLLAARHAEDAAHWLGGAIAASVAATMKEVRHGSDFGASLAQLEAALEALGREFEARERKGER
ncbi:MAG: hypothetical protein ABR570_15600 [Burkholderiales bacterium]